jgi:hypothetical protein
MENLQLERNSGQWTLFIVSRTSTFRIFCQKHAIKNTGGIYVLT